MKKRVILVTGGAGFIGSHTTKELLKNNYQTVVFDNLESGHKEAIVGGEFVRGDLRSKKEIEKVFAQHKIDAVFHFAAYASVPDSVVNPQKYFENNITGGLNLLNAILKYNVRKIVFSSSAAVYGNLEKMPLSEEMAGRPTNPYGLTKWQFEEILRAYDKSYNLRSVSLRYFCAAGADPEGELGENHRPETHLIPRVLKAILGEAPVKIFGTDYPTPDGTAIRDFVHVSDLAKAHVAALEYLFSGGKTNNYNCGIGKGYSVREVIETAKRVTGKKVPSKIARRRQGDPIKLIAEVKKIKKELGWKAEIKDLETIIQTAWRWYGK